MEGNVHVDKYNYNCEKCNYRIESAYIYRFCCPYDGGCACTAMLPTAGASRPIGDGTLMPATSSLRFRCNVSEYFGRDFVRGVIVGRRRDLKLFVRRGHIIVQLAHASAPFRAQFVGAHVVIRVLFGYDVGVGRRGRQEIAHGFPVVVGRRIVLACDHRRKMPINIVTHHHTVFLFHQEQGGYVVDVGGKRQSCTVLHDNEYLVRGVVPHTFVDADAVELIDQIVFD